MNDLALRICYYNEIYKDKINKLEKENKIMKKQIDALTSTTINGYTIKIVYCEYNCGTWDVYEDKDGFLNDKLRPCDICLKWTCYDCLAKYWDNEFTCKECIGE